jgi:DNA-binding response OmpR family regulator
MPDRDGLDLLREVRRRWPASRRFLASGDPVEEIADGLGESFLRKPVDVSEILAVLTRTPKD